MEVQAWGVAVRVATAIPGLEVHPASAISLSDQTHADPHARQTTSARRASLALIPITREANVGGLLAFLLKGANPLISSLVEKAGGFCSVPLSADDIGESISLGACSGCEGEPMAELKNYSHDDISSNP
jgi:hypothetical protein